MFRRRPLDAPLPSWPARFGVRSREQVARDLRLVASHLLPRDRYVFDVRSIGLLRPDLSLPAYAGLVPKSGVSPIFNFFDRTGGGVRWRALVSRNRQRDFRGGTLSYDEHDGTDFVCPAGTPIVAAAPGIVVATRDNWLRGGLTACLDHGAGLVTQYTHLTSLTVPVGSPVTRGQAFALSGVSGFDIAQFFPWVPPHLHFMVWVSGRPVDPYLADGEHPRPGTWLLRNDPRSVSGSLEGDRDPETIDSCVDRAAIERALSACRDPRILRELEGAPSDAARAAILEDSVHHDAPAWPEAMAHAMFRTAAEPSPVALTLPLTHELYRCAAPGDAPWTRP